MYGFAFLKVNIKQYEGVFQFLYAAVTAISMFILSKAGVEKGEKFVKFRNPRSYCVAIMIILGFAMLGVVSIYMLIVHNIADHFKPVSEAIETYNTSLDRSAQTDMAKVPVWDNILYMISLTFLVPIAEELMFRGIITGALAKKFNGPFTVIVSAVIFGLMHGISVQVGYAFICGLLLAFVYYYTANLWYTVIMHALFNFFGSTIAYFFNLKYVPIAPRTKATLWFVFDRIELISVMLAAVFLMILYYGWKANARFPEGLEPGFELFKDKVTEEDDIDETEMKSYEQA
ncbi:MAG: CPBP family intramembrane metalloprotease [Clostridiales bacterium]|nr:CPBP family intramembrane metalloprotease [Clostridiales bacterium]